MRRLLAIATASLAALTLADPAPAQTPAELERTAAYSASFQNPDGGFAGQKGQPSSLGATSSAIRTLGFAGGSIPDVAKCIAYVKSCYDPTVGGFAPTPGGKVDVGTTASGLMALGALKVAPTPFAEACIVYFSKQAKTFEQVRISVAGLEAIKATSPDFPRWIEQVKEGQNPDGTFGEGPARPRATGSKVAALLRMNLTLEPEKKLAIVKALRDGQKPDGGWAEADGPSDLGTSYRIMRAFSMMKEKPDLDRLKGYLARHRREDGGYAPTPSGASDLGGTYYCSIMNYWARRLDGEPPLVETAGFVPLFNGKDLTGWEGDSSLWSARDGVLVGESAGIKQNNFLATEATYGDFILKFTVRLAGDSGNSGVQFRSVRVPGHEMAGYQADIGPGYWASLYDESRRNRVLKPASEKALAALHKGDWNHYVIRAMGGEISLSLNGVESVKYQETDAEIARTGRIAVQIHAGGPMKVEFKDIYIQALPDPKVRANANEPGFHLRTIKTSAGERKYTLFVPEGYDGSKAFPAILFLHGSGERGDDGIKGGQIGLGAAILAHPDRFPALVILPQASKTWAADSDDAKDALAALDDVMATYKVDTQRVALTGLSMGGAGTWSIATAFPGKFSRIAPICGRGKPEAVEAIKGLPSWIIVGDEDGAATVQNARSMAQALRDLGATPRQTEYRAVGHNSWDRAYNDPKLIEWLIKPAR
jgi:poly(3-hydroxybutyrate) depolymerase/prenyltransferase beta subunit